MSDISGFITSLSIVLAVALGALLITLGTWAVSFVRTNRRTRIATHQPLVTYYRGLALGH